MSLISSLNIATEALAVSQAAITVVSNNIANVDTEGYSKLRVNQEALIGTYNSINNSPILEAESMRGVSIQSITRYSNSYLQNYYWNENSTSSYYNQYSTIASNIEDLTNELQDGGLSDALSTFYEAVNTLSNNASDITARTNYATAAENLCSVFNSMSAKISNIQTTLVGTPGNTSSSELASNVNDVNNLLDQLAKVNYNIVRTNGDDDVSSAGLLDQRDSIVSKISSLINVTTTENKNGTVSLSMGNYTLVNGAQLAGHLSESYPNTTTGVRINLVDPENPTKTLGDVTNNVTAGSIAAILDSCGTDNTKLNVNGVLNDLNAMANSFASVMNAIQTQTNYPSGTSTPMCMNSTGTALQISGATNYLFVNKDSATTSAAGITAANIAVNSAITTDPFLVAAARVANPAATGATTQIGNNSNMTIVLDARTNSSYFSSTAIGNNTVEKYLSNSVTDVGTQKENIDNNAKSQSKVLDEIQTKLQSDVGVNLNEELTDLIKYQRAYEAAARVFSTCNSLLEEMVNLGR